MNAQRGREAVRSQLENQAVLWDDCDREMNKIV